MCVCVYICRSVGVTIAIRIGLQGHKLRICDEKVQTGLGLPMAAIGTLKFGFGDILLFGLLLISYK